MSVCDRPGRGVLQSSACAGADAGAPLCKTEDGARHPSAITPPKPKATIARFVVISRLLHPRRIWRH
jgi:hypothetical protein